MSEKTAPALARIDALLPALARLPDSPDRRRLIEDADALRRAVAAYVRAGQWTAEAPDEAAEIAGPYMGIGPTFIRAALKHNRPNIQALDNQQAMDRVLDFMKDLGYVAQRPTDYAELTYQRDAVRALSSPR